MSSHPGPSRPAEEGEERERDSREGRHQDKALTPRKDHLPPYSTVKPIVAFYFDFFEIWVSNKNWWRVIYDTRLGWVHVAFLEHTDNGKVLATHLSAFQPTAHSALTGHNKHSQEIPLHSYVKKVLISAKAR